MIKRLILLIFIVYYLNSCSNYSTKESAEILNFKSYTFRNSSDSIKTQLGQIEVPLNRSNKVGRKIKLTFMKIKGPIHESTTALFYLEGGPGSPAIKSNRFDLYKKLSEFGDVIILDQRGTGMSEEDLACPLMKNYPRDQPITAELTMGLHLSMASECKDYLAKKGIDINSYNTLESAHDINDLREALGYDKITLVGMSYGSHLGLAVIRFYQKYIDKAILAGVEGYDHTYINALNIR